MGCCQDVKFAIDFEAKLAKIAAQNQSEAVNFGANFVGKLCQANEPQKTSRNHLSCRP